MFCLLDRQVPLNVFTVSVSAAGRPVASIPPPVDRPRQLSVSSLISILTVGLT